MPGIDERAENWQGLYKVCQEMERELEEAKTPRAQALKNISKYCLAIIAELKNLR